MSNARKAASLRFYDIYEKEAARTRKELEFWKERAEHEEALTADKEKAAARTRRYTDLLLERYKKCLAVRLMAEEAIRHAPTPRHQLLLRLHYIDRLTLEAAAEKMDLSTRQVMRLHQQALEALPERLCQPLAGDGTQIHA